MTTLTWVSGSTKNWSDSTAWSPAQQPTAADDLIFGGGSTGTLTVDGTSGTPNLCRSVDFTGFTGTLVMAASKQINIGTSTAGAFKMDAAVTFAPASSSLLNFISTTTGNNITSGGKSLPPMTFNGVGGAWTFQDNITAATDPSALTLTNGSLDTNNVTVTGYNLSSSNSNVRALTLGSTTWASQAWNISTSTNMTFSAGTSNIVNTATTGNGSLLGGGLTYYNYTSTSITSGSISISGANTFNDLTLSKASGGTPSGSTGYSVSGNLIVLGNFVANGISASDRNFIKSNTDNTQRTITVTGSASATHTDFRDIGAPGTAITGDSPTSSACGNGGGNSGITFTAAKICYMKTATSVNWSASNWYTTSGGSTLISPTIPLLQDKAMFDVNSITAGSVVITVDMPRLPAWTFSGALNSPTLAYGSSVYREHHGPVARQSGMSHTSTSSGSYFYTGSQDWGITGIGDSSGLTWPAPSENISFRGVGEGKGAFAYNGSFIINSTGTWNDNGYTFTLGSTLSNGGVATFATTTCATFGTGNNANQVTTINGLTCTSAFQPEGALGTVNVLGTVSGSGTSTFSIGFNTNTLNIYGSLTGFTTCTLSSSASIINMYVGSSISCTTFNMTAGTLTHQRGETAGVSTITASSSIQVDTTSTAVFSRLVSGGSIALGSGSANVSTLSFSPMSIAADGTVYKSGCEWVTTMDLNGHGTASSSNILNGIPYYTPDVGSGKAKMDITAVPYFGSDLYGGLI